MSSVWGGKLEMMRHDPTVADVVPLQTRRVAASRQEQERLISQLAREHGSALRVLAARLVGANDAEDMAQDAFVSFLRWIKGRPQSQVEELFRSHDGVQRLLCRITACRAYDYLRRRSSRQNAVTANENQTDRPAHEVPQQHIGIDIERLERAYATLPPAQRIAHVLHHYYGFTDADFEATLGLTRTNSRTLVHRAHLALKRAMEIRQ